MRCAIALIGRTAAGARLHFGGRFGHLDVPGTLLLGGSLLLLNLGLSAGGGVGVSQESAMRALGGTRNPLGDYLVPLILGGLIALTLFAFWERRANHPILPGPLFRERPFVAGICANFLVGASLIVAVVDVPVIVALLVSEDRIGAVTALLLAPFTISMAALSFAGGVVASRFGGRRTAAGGLILVVLGYVVLWIGLRGDHYLRLIPGMLIAGTGFGLVAAPISGSVIDIAPARDRGVAAAFAILFRLLGMTIGISALTAIGVRRLQTLTSRGGPLLPKPGEGTGEFLVRQTIVIEGYALSVVRETFLIAAALALLAVVPIALMQSRRTAGGDSSTGVESSLPSLETAPRSETSVPQERREKPRLGQRLAQGADRLGDRYVG
jgi:hypothetical protein